MNCREFEDRWNEVLDAGSESLPDLERVLEAHSTTCESCQAIAARYQLLRQAVAVWAPAPALSAESVERLRRLSIGRRPRRRFVAHWVRFAIPLATAAVVFALVRVGTAWRNEPAVPAAIARPGPAVVGPSERPIETALTEVTSATIDLALEASAPAARIGRDVLTLETTADASDVRPGEADLAANANADVDPADADVAASASEMLQTVGERVNAGVKPISGSARHAFSFLLGPPPGSDRHPAESVR